MKGYKEKLKQFINYVFEKYAKDEEIQNFQSLHFIREKELEKRRARSKPSKKISISLGSADICKRLVSAEIGKDILLQQYSKEFIDKLKFAYKELDNKK